MSAKRDEYGEALDRFSATINSLQVFDPLDR